MNKTTPLQDDRKAGKNALGNNPYFDLKMASAGALFMGIMVFLVNLGHGPLASLVPAFKQAFYTFFIGGTMVRICENSALYFDNPVVSKIMSVLVPSVITLGLTYLVHRLKGTPEPLLSTLPTLLFAPPSFAVWGIRKRKQLDKMRQERSETKNQV